MSQHPNRSPTGAWVLCFVFPECHQKWMFNYPSKSRVSRINKGKLKGEQSHRLWQMAQNITRANGWNFLRQTKGFLRKNMVRHIHVDVIAWEETVLRKPQVVTSILWSKSGRVEIIPLLSWGHVDNQKGLRNEQEDCSKDTATRATGLYTHVQCSCISTMGGYAGAVNSHSQILCAKTRASPHLYLWWHDFLILWEHHHLARFLSFSTFHLTYPSLSLIITPLLNVCEQESVRREVPPPPPVRKDSHWCRWPAENYCCR